MSKPRLPPELRAASFIDPEFYFRRVLGLIHVTEYQIAICKALADEEIDQVAARSANGVGKSFISACALNWWFDTREDSIVIIGAPKFGQACETYKLGMQLRRGARYELDGDIKATELRMGERAKWYVAPRTAKSPESFAGVHAPGKVLAIMEEASGLEDRIYAAAYGCVTSDGDKMLHIGNPTKPVGVFAGLFTKGSAWTITISAKQSPNYIEGRDVVPGLVGRKGVKRLIEVFGADSDVVRVRVHGLPPQGSGNGVFGFRDVQDAVDRGLSRFQEVDVKKDGEVRQEWKDTRARLDSRIVGGFDVARMGDDTCRLATIKDGVLLPDIEVWEKARTTESRDRCLAWLKRTGPSSILNIDAGGGGAEIYDLLLEHVPAERLRLTMFGGRQILGQFFEPSGTVVKKEGKWTSEMVPLYHNRRTELWAEAAKWCRTSGVIHPGFNEAQMTELETELLAPEWAPNERKSLLMEEKIMTKKRLGRSPDVGDAVCLAIALEIGMPQPALPPPRPRDGSPKNRATVAKKRNRLDGYAPAGSRRVMEEW